MRRAVREVVCFASTGSGLPLRLAAKSKPASPLTAAATATRPPARPIPGERSLCPRGPDRGAAARPALLLAGASGSEAQRRRRTRHGADVRYRASPEDVIARLRENDVTLTFDPAAGTLHAEGAAAIQIVTRKEAG